MAQTMSDVTGTSTDTNGTSAVPQWLDSRGGAGAGRWRAPVHSVATAEWKDQFSFQGAIGSGGFGSVTRATHKGTGTQVAIKLVYDRTNDGRPTGKSESVRHEIETMRRLDHSSVVSLVEVFVQKPTPQEADPNAPWVRRWYLVLELCQGQDLQRLLSKRGALPLALSSAIFGQLASAIAYLHWRGVVHRDIKPGNVILLDASATGGAVKIKLIDFGLAEAMDPQFIRYYRSQARRRAKFEHRSLPAPFVDQDSNHPPKPAFALPGHADSDDDDAPGTTAMLNPSRGNTPFLAVGAPQPPLADRRSGGATATRERPSPQPRAGQRAPSLAADPSRWRSSPSRFNFDMVPTGTKEFAAPEVYQERRFKPSKGAVGGTVEDVMVPTPVNSDSFSLGVLFRYCLTGVPPEYADVDRYVRFMRVNPLWHAKRAALACLGRAPYHLRTLGELPPEARDLVTGLTDTDYHSRLTMNDILTHAWVTRADEWVSLADAEREDAGVALGASAVAPVAEGSVASSEAAAAAGKSGRLPRGMRGDGVASRA